MEAAAPNREIDGEGRGRAPPVPAPTGRPVSPAEWVCKRPVLYQQAFEDGLDEQHEAAMGFARGARRRGDADRRSGVSAPDVVTFQGMDGSGATAPGWSSRSAR